MLTRPTHAPETRGLFFRMPGMVALALGLVALAPAAAAQLDDNPVYVDDSPHAWELFHQAADQERENAGESARLYQELLDRYPFKLIPRSEVERDLFDSVRSRVHRALVRAPQVLERYRSIETPQAQRLLEEGRIEELLATRFLTAPAVEAALRLAQREFEAAHFERARAILAELAPHPDLAGRPAAHRHFLLVLCANYLGDTVQRQEGLDALVAAGDALSLTLHREAMRLLTAGPGPEPARGLTVIDRAPDAQPQVISGTPIWSVPLARSLYNRRFQQDLDTRGFGPGMDANRRMGDLLTAAPTVAGQHVFVNEGEVVRAFDRFSQREFWSLEVGVGAPEVPRNTTRVGDLNIVAVNGDRVVTFTGHAAEQERRGSARVICIDARTGQLIWSVSLNRLLGSEEYEGLFPYGAPIIADGVVYLLARKASRQVLMSTYLVALNLDDDNAERVRWVRYIASAGGLQNSIMRPYSMLQYDRGHLIVATPVGAVASVDALRGETQWLRRVPAPLSTNGTPPWEMAAPVVTEREIYALSPDFTAILVLDRATGVETARHQASEWGGPRYLLGGSDMIYAIGNTIVARLYSDPSMNAWARSSAETSGPGDEADAMPTSRAFDLRGRVQIAGDMLVVPTQSAVLFLDGHRGTILRSIPIEGAGNPLCTGPELFLAQNDALVAYIPLAVAEANLREQIALSPENPQPPLSLLRLAAKMEDGEASLTLALEAADLVSNALARMTDEYERAAAQEELFDTLLSVAAREQDLPHQRGIELYGRIGAIAADPRQRIEHLLAKGDYLARIAATVDRSYLTAAIESYQTILTQPALAAAERRSPQVAQPAADVAAQRLAEIIAKFGPDAYASFAAFAQRQLEQLPADAGPDQLLALAQAYPFADASRLAGRRAAELLAAAGQPRAALAVLESQRATAPPQNQAQLIGAIVELAIENNWPQLATAWLRHARDHRQLAGLTIAGGERAIDHMLAELDPAALLIPQPAIQRIIATAETVPSVLEGRLVPAAPGGALPPSALIVHANDLRRIDQSIDNPVWTATVPATAVELLDYRPGSILLWLPDAGGEIMLIDESTGTLRWQSHEFRHALSALRGAGAKPRTLSLDLAGSGGRVDAIEPLPLPGPEDVIVVGRSGGMIRQRFADAPDVVIWQRDHPLYAVHYAARHDLAVILAGVRAAADGATTGVVALLDPETGEMLREIVPMRRDPVQWLAVTRLGMLILGTQGGIESFELSSGRRLWSNQSREASGFARAWTFGEDIFVADALSRLHAIDPVTGSLSAPFEASPVDDEPTFELIGLHASGPDVLAHYRQRIVRYGPDGTFLCQDAVVSQRDFTHLVPLDGGRALVVSHVPRQPGNDPIERRAARNAHDNWLYILDESCKIVQQERIAGDRDVLQAVGVSTGWIMLSQRQQTIAIPTR